MHGASADEAVPRAAPTEAAPMTSVSKQLESTGMVTDPTNGTLMLGERQIPVCRATLVRERFTEGRVTVTSHPIELWSATSRTVLWKVETSKPQVGETITTAASQAGQRR